jgi:hypothetical protein
LAQLQNWNGEATLHGDRCIDQCTGLSNAAASLLSRQALLLPSNVADLEGTRYIAMMLDRWRR